MSRKLTTEEINVVNETALAADKAGVQTSGKQLDIIDYYVNWSNGVANDFVLKIQNSNDGITWDDYYQTNPITMNAASGSHFVRVSYPNRKYIRPYIVRNAGQIDVNIKVIGTTVGA